MRFTVTTWNINSVRLRIGPGAQVHAAPERAA